MNDKTQLDKFKDAARDLECDNDSERYQAALHKLLGKTKRKRTGRAPHKPVD
jgi:hypothetical protein